MPATDPARPTFLRRRDVEADTKLSRSSIYRMIGRGEFPAPRRIGPRAVAWLQRDIADWISTRPQARDGE